jgi:hypothetical protein
VDLADVCERFAGLSDVPKEHREIRGVILAVAQDWLVRLEDGPAKDEAIDHLFQAAELACKVARAA